MSDVQQFTYTATGVTTGPTQDSYDSVASVWSLQVSGTGGVPTSFNVVLEGSNDGTNFTTILTATANGAVVFQAAGQRNPVRFFRIRVTALTLGPASNIVCIAIGSAY